MSQTSKIEWTDATWNPVRGCSRVSEGCRHCYAERVAARFSGAREMQDGGPTRVDLGPYPYAGLAVMTPSGPRWTGKVRLVEELLDWPLRRRKPLRIFVNSMSDLFHEGLTDEQITRVFDVMLRSLRTTPHMFQILTKRPQRMLDFCRTIAPLHETQNIWLGVSVEDQATADGRIPLLLQTPAAVRWISAEPLLGPIDFSHDTEAGILSYLTRFDGGDPPTEKLDWVVVGGESGPGARPMHPGWARSLRNQCQAAGVPFFFKQWGDWLGARQDGSPEHNPMHLNAGDESIRVGKKAAGRLLDGCEWNEFPSEDRA